MTFNPDFFPWETEEQNDNCLMQYLQQQHPETLERIAQSVSSEIKDIISQNVTKTVKYSNKKQFRFKSFLQCPVVNKILARLERT